MQESKAYYRTVQLLGLRTLVTAVFIVKDAPSGSAGSRGTWHLSRLPLPATIPAFLHKPCNACQKPSEFTCMVSGSVWRVNHISVLAELLSERRLLPYLPPNLLQLNNQEFSLIHLVALHIFIRTTSYCACNHEQLCCH